MFRWRKKKCRGRKLREIYITSIPDVKAIIPSPRMNDAIITLNFAETEALRLIDFEDMSFDDAARKMGTSKATVWRLVKSARKKIARVLFEGKTLILTEGGVIEKL